VIAFFTKTIGMSWLQKLQSRWKVDSILQVIIILIVFACTGFTVVFLKRPIFNYWFGETIPSWATASYYILILPVYNLLLLFYGFLFGQFKFFWGFEKRFFGRVASIFRSKK
jgi:hypothetical protein